MRILGAVVIACALLLGCADRQSPGSERGPEKVGVTSLSFVDLDRQRPLAVKLWYPADGAAVEERQNYARAFLGYAAPEAGTKGGRWPLALLSHGDKGNSASQAWLGELLASHGYIVAAVDHWLNTNDHYEPEETVRVWHRPHDISVVIDRLLSDDFWGERIDASRIVALGHSSGGYTALALAGAVYDPQGIIDYCSGDEAGPACALVEGVDLAAIDYTAAGDSYRDARIRGVVALAPALGPAITVESLQKVSVPALIITTDDDEVLSLEHNAERYHRHTQGSEFVLLNGGGHFVFLSRCNAVAALIIRFAEDFDICGSRSAVDRGEVHRRIGLSVLDFLKKVSTERR